MRIYQILNESGYPASFEITNPSALYTTKKDCKRAITYLKECTENKRTYKGFTIRQIK